MVVVVGQRVVGGDDALGVDLGVKGREEGGGGKGEDGGGGEVGGVGEVEVLEGDGGVALEEGLVCGFGGGGVGGDGSGDGGGG